MNESEAMALKASLREIGAILSEIRLETMALKERLREAEELLSEILRLAHHLESRGLTFLTMSHENRIRKFLCLLPRVQARIKG